MTGNERRISELLGRVQAFDAAHGAIFAAGSKARELFALVDDAATQSAQIAARQESGSGQFHGGTAQKNLEDEAVKSQLRAIIETARPAYRNAPELQKQFRMPADSHSALLAGARAILELTRRPEVHAELVARELPADFDDDLEAAITDFDAASDVQDTGAQERAGATRSLGEILQSGLSALRELSPIVQNKFRGNAQVLGAWATASHLEKAARKAKPET